MNFTLELALISSTKINNRNVAQLGSAFVWGTKGRRFKSSRSDQLQTIDIAKFIDFRLMSKKCIFHVPLHTHYTNVGKVVQLIVTSGRKLLLALR